MVRLRKIILTIIETKKKKTHGKAVFNGRRRDKNIEAKRQRERQKIRQTQLKREERRK